MFVNAIVVAGDSSRADIYSGADNCISQITKMVSLGSISNSHFLSLNEVPDVSLFADVAPGANVGIGAKLCTIGYLGFGKDAAVAKRSTWSPIVVFSTTENDAIRDSEPTFVLPRS